MQHADHQLHEMSYRFVARARHCAISAWCGISMRSTTPNTKHQRPKEPSPG